MFLPSVCGFIQQVYLPGHIYEKERKWWEKKFKLFKWTPILSRNEVIIEITGFKNLLEFLLIYFKSTLSITEMILIKRKNDFQNLHCAIIHFPGIFLMLVIKMYKAKPRNTVCLVRCVKMHKPRRIVITWEELARKGKGIFNNFS
jgi:hypothetical protein